MSSWFYLNHFWIIPLVLFYFLFDSINFYQWPYRLIIHFNREKFPILSPYLFIYFNISENFQTKECFFPFLINFIFPNIINYLIYSNCLLCLVYSIMLCCFLYYIQCYIYFLNLNQSEMIDSSSICLKFLFISKWRLAPTVGFDLNHN